MRGLPSQVSVSEETLTFSICFETPSSPLRLDLSNGKASVTATHLELVISTTRMLHTASVG